MYLQTDWTYLFNQQNNRTYFIRACPFCVMEVRRRGEERDWCKEKKPSGANSVWSVWKLFSWSAAPRCSLFGSAFFNEFITLWGVCLCQNVTFCLFCLRREPQLGLHLLFWPFVSRGQTSKRNCCFARFLETFVLFRCEEGFFFASFKSFVPRGQRRKSTRGEYWMKIKIN